MTRRSRIGLSTALASLIVVLASPSAHADDGRAKAKQPLIFKLHLTPPLGQWVIRNVFGSPESNGERSTSRAAQLTAVSIVGGSGSVELDEFWAFEAGGNWLYTAIEAQGYDVFARAGVAPVILDTRRTNGRGWTGQFDALLGYRALKRYDAPDAHHGTELTHGIRGDVGVDFVRHFGSIGFGMRLLTGVTVPRRPNSHRLLEEPSLYRYR